MTDVTENQTDVAAEAVLDKKSIDKCTKGLVDKFNSPVQGIDVSNKHQVYFWVEINSKHCSLGF